MLPLTEQLSQTQQRRENQNTLPLGQNLLSGEIYTSETSALPLFCKRFRVHFRRQPLSGLLKNVVDSNHLLHRQHDELVLTRKTNGAGCRYRRSDDPGKVLQTVHVSIMQLRSAQVEHRDQPVRFTFRMQTARETLRRCKKVVGRVFRPQTKICGPSLLNDILFFMRQRRRIATQNRTCADWFGAFLHSKSVR